MFPSSRLSETKPRLRGHAESASFPTKVKPSSPITRCASGELSKTRPRRNSFLLFDTLLNILVRDEIIELRTSGRGHSLLVVVSARRKLAGFADVQRSLVLP